MIKNLKTARPVAQLQQGRHDWYRIENSADSAVLHIYDEIGYFGVTAQDMIADLAQVKAKGITVHLNSPGGEVFDGIAIMEALRNHPAKVTVKIDSLAASIASVIAMAGDRIVIGQHATMMIHNGHGMCIGEAKDMRQLADLLDRTSDNIASVYAGRSGKGDIAYWRGLMDAETWFSAEEAVEAGLADEVAAGPGQVDNSWDLSIYGKARRRWVTEDGDACPTCKENEAAGSVAVGRNFPSGHRRPPAHPNCRCRTEKVKPESDAQDASEDSVNNETSAPHADTPAPESAYTIDPELFRSAIREAVAL